MNDARRFLNTTFRSLVLVFTVMSASQAADPPAAGEPAPAPVVAPESPEPAATPPAVEAAKPAPKDLVLKGDAKCTRCHDENDNAPVLAIGKTRHGVLADGRNPTCTSCHGDSENHINVPEGVKERPKPDRTFTKNSSTPVDARNTACLACHQGSRRMLWAGSAHQSHDVACTDCHEIHTQHDKVRDKLTQPDKCFTCHKEQRALVNRPVHHPVLEGKVACSDCHNPHGSAGPKLLVRDSVNATCYTCHMEKRGPFLWEHMPVTDDCTNCHNPHGSTVERLLKVRMPFLCQQCHEPTSHRGNVPGFINANPYDNQPQSRGITQARACLNCHTNIHGGNSPTNNAAARSFRR